MPHGVRKFGSKWKIVDKRSGKVKGSSDTKKKAQTSARIRTSARTTDARSATQRAG